MIKLITTLIIIVGIVIQIKRKRPLSSASLWYFCYLLIFILTPLVSGESYANQRSLDMLALIGAISFFIGSLMGNAIKINIKIKEEENKTEYDTLPLIKLYIASLIISVLILIVDKGASTIGQLLSGNITSKQLILSDGSIGTIIFSFVLNISTILLISIWCYSGKRYKKTKWLLLFIYAIINTLFSFTRIFLISTIVMIIFYELRNTRINKQLRIITIAILALAIVMTTLNFVRNLGTNGDYDFSDIANTENMIEGTDFSVAYKYFDKLLTEGSPYIIPLSYLKPLYVIIPRTVWETKPETLNVEIMKRIDPAKAKSGFTAATSVLGEGYAVLGYAGIIIYPILWGIICTVLDRRYEYHNRNNSYAKMISYYIFATLIVISGQRGDWSTYLTIIVWLYLLPLAIINRRLKKYENK